MSTEPPSSGFNSTSLKESLSINSTAQNVTDKVSATDSVVPGNVSSIAANGVVTSPQSDNITPSVHQSKNIPDATNTAPATTTATITASGSTSGGVLALTFSNNTSNQAADTSASTSSNRSSARVDSTMTIVSTTVQSGSFTTTVPTPRVIVENNEGDTRVGYKFDNEQLNEERQTIMQSLRRRLRRIRDDLRKKRVDSSSSSDSSSNE